MSDGVRGGRPQALEARAAVLRGRPFAFFWSASTLRAFGGAISGVGAQVLIVTVLAATPVQVGVLNALGVAPYLVLGLVVGALMDRRRRQRTLVLATIGHALVLGAIAVLLLLGVLRIWSLALLLLIQGVLTLFTQSAEQPLLPRLVARPALVAANARLGQSATVATTAGPALGGALLTLVSTPLLFVVDAVVTAAAAVLQSRIVVDEPRAAARPVGRHIGHDVLDGLRYTYRHRTLRPLAISVHVWFAGNSIVSTAFALFALRGLQLPAWAFGVALALGGLGGLLGAVAAPGIGSRIGAGRAVLLGRALAVLPWLLLALAPVGPADAVGLRLLPVAAAQLLWGLSMGVEDANDTGYRQSVAPDAMQGRMNATIRTVNRAVFFIGALVTGLLVTGLGPRPAIGIGAVVFAAAAAVVLASPLRSARLGDSSGTWVRRRPDVSRGARPVPPAASSRRPAGRPAP